MKLQNLLSQLAIIFFFLLAGGFVLYNEVIARGFFPPILGGYFGIVSMGALLLLGLPSLSLLIANAVNGKFLYAQAVISFFAWISLVTLIYWVIGHEHYQVEAVRQSFESLLLWFSLFSVGSFFRLDKVLSQTVFWFLAASAVFMFFYWLG